jgi:hypothetical protein
MDHKQKMEIFEETVDAMRELLTTKGVEYSTVTDALANFKDPANDEMDVNPLQVCMIHFNKQLAGIRSYIKHGKTFSTETIWSRIHDDMNYLFLLKCLIMEIEGILSLRRAAEREADPAHS